MADSGYSLFAPTLQIAVDVSSVDFNCATCFPGMPYVRRLYIGTSAPSDVKVDTLGATGIVYKNVIQGGYLTGLFTKIYHTGTTATNIVAEA
jgi:hypothetical protein